MGKIQVVPTLEKNKNKKVSVEIDYDKLAEAIVKAQIKLNQSEPSHQKPRPSWKKFWRNIWEIICRKNKTNGDLTIDGFKLILSITFDTLCFAGVFVFIKFLVFTINHFGDFVWSKNAIVYNVIDIVMFSVIGVIILLISLLFRGAAHEMQYEKDRHFVMAVFSSFISIIAVIISIIALV